MSLSQWESNGWLRSHATSREEIGNLLRIARRDLSDAGSQGISDDWRFGIAFNAALKLCTAVADADELIEFTKSLEQDVLRWFRERRPELF
jgi:hypothetical protein